MASAIMLWFWRNLIDRIESRQIRDDAVPVGCLNLIDRIESGLGPVVTGGLLEPESNR